jgi:SAM-dependent methyltransferase
VEQSQKQDAPELESLLDRYRKTPALIEVNFRHMMSPKATGDRATHHIHPYPAKLLAQIPQYFLRSEVLSKRGDLVADPFCGSGTVLLEALLSGRHAVGLDTNPLACLISRAKTRRLDPAALEASALLILANISKAADEPPPPVVNLAYWFYPHVIKALNRIRRAILEVADSATRDFFLTCLSVCIRHVSLADPRLGVPVKLRMDTYPQDHALHDAMKSRLIRLKRISVLDEFFRVVRDNIGRMKDFSLLYHGKIYGTVLQSDARQLLVASSGATRKLLPKASVQLVVTSPPYPGAQKYIRASSLSLGWLGLCRPDELRALECQNIGREHYLKCEYLQVTTTGIPLADCLLTQIRSTNPLRAHIAAHYLVEMRSALMGISRVLQKGGYLVLVCGNNHVCGLTFRTSEYLQTLAEEAGLVLRLQLRDEIRSRGLMTKRNRTASVIECEYISLFQKA